LGLVGGLFVKGPEGKRYSLFFFEKCKKVLGGVIAPGKSEGKRQTRKKKTPERVKAGTWETPKIRSPANGRGK